jgi:LDH2 family malate/lactate/ureidoglycolate dehydrogenase
MLTFTPETLHDAVTRIFLAAGADEENARVVADHLIDAHLTGYDSHGVMRIPGYVRFIEQGQLAPAARPRVVRETAAMTLIDAQRTFGQVSACFATDAVVAKARAQGVAVAGTIHGNNTGRLGYYPTRAAAQGVALLVAYGQLGGSGAPYGGRAGALGTNPFSIGFPAAGGTPFVLDFATTAIAGGRVALARDAHAPLPPGAAIDRAGRPTTDPAALGQGGALLPFGGHKGYALSLTALLLSNVLVRAGDETDQGGGEGGRGVAKVFFCAFDTRVFGEGAPDAAADVFRHLRSVPPADGFDRVLIPGDRAAQTASRRRETGIPVAEATWQRVAETAARLGVSLPPGGA